MKLRVRFGKKGVVKFIGHLDMMRYFQKAFRRADWDIKYSQGYHPHPILSFASPLGVGLESTGEYMDVEVNTCKDFEEMKNDLNAQMVDGVTVLDVHALPDSASNAMSIIAAADYEVAFREGMTPCSVEALKNAVENMLNRTEIIVMKKTKKSEREMDIRPLIYEMKVTENGSIWMKTGAGSVANLKPELVLETMYGYNEWSIDPYAWMVTRCDMYAANQDGNGCITLVSLEKYLG